jgi:site-specific DNA recombinase
VRELRNKNVEVYFDKEAISTNDTKVDMMLTIFASFAQEESKSISENVKWGVRKRMAKGQRKMNVKTTLGYKTNHEGKVIIDESTKDIVVQVFNLFAAGYTYREIAQIMTNRGIKTGTGKDVWKVYDIDKIISNEKYVGDFVMQKTCVVDFLDHKVVKNNGVEEKYIFQNHHDAIIDREKFNEIQSLRKAKFTKGNNSTSKVNLISKTFYCERCLRNMKVITIHPGTNYARRVFTCKVNNKTSPHYKDCDAPLTINYELMNRAISEVFAKFNNLPKEVDVTISDAYHSTVQSIIEKIGEYKTLITEAEEKMSALIKLQMEEDDVLKYQDEFNIQKSNVGHYKDEISRLEQVLSEEGKQYLIKEKINQYIAEGTITSEILGEVLKAVIRRKDNSIRFVISDKPVQVDSTTIDDLLDSKPVYSSCATDKTSTLLFDVVKLEEEVDEH